MTWESQLHAAALEVQRLEDIERRQKIDVDEASREFEERRQLLNKTTEQRKAAELKLVNIARNGRATETPGPARTAEDEKWTRPEEQ